MVKQDVTAYLGGVVKTTYTKTIENGEVTEQRRITVLGIPVKSISRTRPTNFVDNVLNSLNNNDVVE